VLIDQFFDDLILGLALGLNLTFGKQGLAHGVA